MIKVKTISNLIKVFPNEEPKGEIINASILKNEVFSYQISIFSSENLTLNYELISDIKENISLRVVNYIYATMLGIADNEDNYVLKDKKTPTSFPDLLTPLGSQIKLKKDEWTTIYLTIREVKKSGNFDIVFNLLNDNKIVGNSQFSLAIINKEIDLDKILPNTNWFHYDGIANHYHLNVFSKKYNKIMVNFLKDQREHGINMLFVPLFTPPLDTYPGTYRRTAQLVDVEVVDEEYKFNLDRVFNFLDLGRKLGYKYFEMSHLFTQWGAKKAPKVMAKVNGKTKRIFGWGIKSTNPKYLNFVKSFLTKFVKELKARGFKENEVMFHLSDEPHGDAIKTYKKLANVIRKIIKPFKIIDALSDYSFYEKGAIDEPVVAEDALKEYRDHGVKTFVYYCCCQAHDFIPNRFMNMPLNRLRVCGPIMYIDDAKGFLQWGYNFYNTQFSIKRINPFEVPDAGGKFPAGDSYVVYPGENGVPLNSIREESYFDSLQDYALLKMLEDKKGRDYVLDLLSKFNILSYENYPHEDLLCYKLHEELVRKLQKY